jgi:hypothetical protein
MSIIPDTQEVETGGSLSMTHRGKNVRPYLKNKVKQKGLEQGSSGRATT